MVRLGMSGQPLVIEAVNVPALIEDIMIDLAPAADDKGLVLGGMVRCENGASPRICPGMKPSCGKSFPIL